MKHEIVCRSKVILVFIGVFMLATAISCSVDVFKPLGRPVSLDVISALEKATTQQAMEEAIRLAIEKQGKEAVEMREKSRFWASRNARVRLSYYPRQRQG